MQYYDGKYNILFISHKHHQLSSHLTEILLLKHIQDYCSSKVTTYSWLLSNYAYANYAYQKYKLSISLHGATGFKFVWANEHRAEKLNPGFIFSLCNVLTL